MLPISYLLCSTLSFEQEFLATQHKESLMTVSSNYSSYASYGSSATTMAKPNFEEMAKELLNSIDSDASGSVDLSEFTTAMQSSSSSTESTLDSSSLSDIFSKIDSNSDGAMSSEEFLAALEASKPQKSKGNGEMMGSMPPPPPPPSSSDESSQESSISDVFSALDTNKDGTISQDELLALLEDETSDTSSSSTQEQSQTGLKEKMLQNILAYYSSNEITRGSSSLSLSA